MLQTIDLTMRFGSRLLFGDINIKLDQGKRCGLIGANGAGKTTFLKILHGEIDQTSGEVIIENGKRVGVLGQNQFAFEEYTIVDAVLYGNRRLFDAIKAKDEIYARGEYSDADNMALADLEIISVEEDPTYECEIHIEKILEDLGFPASIHQDTMNTLTSADKFKVLLAQVLFLKPDVMFLDEPTNNLDIEAIAWLEEQLIRHDGTLIVISHDRHFLNAVCTNMLDVDYQKIREFAGNYDDWYIASTLAEKQLQVDRDKAMKEKTDLESFIRRFSANASKAKQATSRQKKLDKLNIDDIKPSSRRDPHINFKIHRELGKDILEIKNISHAYDDEEVLNDVSITFKKEDKVALIGANGVGKSTLCKIIMEELKPSSGEVNWGTTVKPGYFPQDTTDKITGNDTLYDWLRAFDKKADLQEIRNCLGRMLFNGEQQEKGVEKTSGGEKHRMMLSKMMLEDSNYLILDEPSNHLDLEAIIALGEALYNYPSGVICVAHDRELLDAFANRIIEVQVDGSIIDFEGSYEEFRTFKASK